MAKILHYSDLHRGMARKANTTPTSNAAREDHTGRALLELLQAHDGPTLCLGDFFDRTSNPEEVILQALPLVQHTTLIMAGNHDVPNRVGQESSLRILKEMYPNQVLMADQERPEGVVTEVEGTLLCFAPHVLTGEGYDAMLDDLAETARGYDGRAQILYLHCNYNLSEHILTSSSLNLTRKRAEELLYSFHYIVMGHVHTPMEDFDGRLLVVGSPYPTAFDNMEDKRLLMYDTDTLSFSSIPIWARDESFSRCLVSELIPYKTQDPLKGEYFDIVDDAEPGVGQQVVLGLFKDGAFGVRLRPAEDAEEQSFKNLSPSRIEELPGMITKDLEQHHEHLLPLWNELRGKQ